MALINHADRLWDRLAKRGWCCVLVGPCQEGPPWHFTASKGSNVIEAKAVTRAEAIIKLAEMLEKSHDQADA